MNLLDGFIAIIVIRVLIDCILFVRNPDEDSFIEMSAGAVAGIILIGIALLIKAVI